MLADFVILRVEYMLWILISHNSFGFKENNVKAGEIHISSLRNQIRESVDSISSERSVTAKFT